MATDTQVENATRLVKQTGVTYDIGWDNTGDLFRRFGELAMPTTVLIDSDGQIHTVRSEVLTEEDLTDMISDLTQTNEHPT